MERSPFGYSEDMLQYCSERNILIQAYSPLTRTKRLGDETLANIASKYNKTAVQVLIRWNLQRGVVPLPKANQKKHLEENISVFDFKISAADMDSLNGLNERYSSLGNLPYVWHKSHSHAHSPCLNTGTRLPSARIPSMSIAFEPIIQSIWMRLLLPPCAAICSGVSVSPPTKHFE